MVYDLLIRGGLVADGTLAPPTRKDVAVKDGRIVAVQVGLDPTGAVAVIDATDRIVSPGFVDNHTHYDAQIHWDPTLDLSSRHGYTTVLAGNCGLSLAPVNPTSAEYMTMALAKVEGIPFDTLKAGVDFAWTSFGSMLDALDGRVAVNIGFLVGHSALRAMVMGERCASSEATADELDAMRKLLRESIEAGGLGFSSSNAETHTDLLGRPVASRFASRDEILELARIAGEYDGTKLEYVPNANSTLTDDIRAWLADLSVAAGRPLDFPLIADQQLTDAEVESLFAAADVARARGGEVLPQVVAQAASLYFNLRSGFLFEALPDPWPEVYTRTSHEQRVASFSDPEMIDRLEAAARVAVERGGNLSRASNFATLFVSSVVEPENEKFVGRSLANVGAELGCSPFRAFVTIALKDDLRTVVEDRPPHSREGWERRVKILRDNRGVVSASDGGAHMDVIDFYAQSSRLINNAVTRFGLMPIEEAVHLLTQVPAELTGLNDRGLVKEGYWADLVVFDPATIGTTPTALHADLPAGGSRLVTDNIGIDHVIVNGEPLYDHGQYTGALSGKVLRSGADTSTVAIPRHPPKTS